MKNKIEHERIQVKCNYDIGILYIQGISNNITRKGRKYRITLKIRSSPDVSLWLREQPATLHSEGSSKLLYIPLELLRYGDGTFQILIKGKGVNHLEGAILDIQILDNPIRDLIDFATKSNLFTDIIGPKYIPKGVELDPCKDKNAKYIT